jgi:hypothetical protein
MKLKDHKNAMSKQYLFMGIYLADAQVSRALSQVNNIERHSPNDKGEISFGDEQQQRFRF